jgi:HNH endonuclease
VIQAPQGFIVAEECRKAAWQNGYRRARGEQCGWAQFESTTAKGSIFLASEGEAGPWLLALDHNGVIAELGLPPDPVAGPGYARFVFVKLADLYAILPRVYDLAVSLPDGPLQDFNDRMAKLGDTDAERLVRVRVGQDVFRENLLRYWSCRCPLTGISEPSLLRASHIKPWAKCESDAERLDVHNGLLLSALWDAAFDAGLVTFEDDGTPAFSRSLSAAARAELHWKSPIQFTHLHCSQLAWHRTNEFERVREA